jgi:hypothetical protein
LEGVRVSQIKLRNREQVEEMMRKNTHEMFGYGIVTRGDIARNGIFLRADQGSPGARAGIGKDWELRLLAVNGYRPASPAKEVARTRAFLRMDDAAQRRAIEKKELPLLLRMHAQPLRLTVKDPQGATRIIVLPRPEKYIFRPDEPTFYRGDPAGNRVALLFSLRDQNFVLHENRTVPGAKQATPPLAEHIRVRGTDVLLSGPPLTPSAFWQRDGVDFTLDNYQLAVARKEALSMIASLLGAEGDRPQ